MCVTHACFSRRGDLQTTACSVPPAAVHNMGLEYYEVLGFRACIKHNDYRGCFDGRLNAADLHPQRYFGVVSVGVHVGRQRPVLIAAFAVFRLDRCVSYVQSSKTSAVWPHPLVSLSTAPPAPFSPTRFAQRLCEQVSPSRSVRPLSTGQPYKLPPGKALMNKESRTHDSAFTQVLPHFDISALKACPSSFVETHCSCHCVTDKHSRLRGMTHLIFS